MNYIITRKASYNVVEERGNIYIGGNTFTCLELSSNILYLDKDTIDCYIVNKTDDWEAADMMYALFYFYKEKNQNCKIE